MSTKLEEKKKKIDEKIEKNLIQKKLILEKEKQKRAAKFSNIGRLAYRANIDEIDEITLLGAFLEISKNMNEEKIKQWKMIANEFSESQSNSNQVFSISFLEEPSQEIKQKLKENKFTWNRFRKEFYGRGSRSEIEILLNGSKFKIEEIVN